MHLQFGQRLAAPEAEILEDVVAFLEVRQEALDDPMLADDLLGALASRRREERLLVLATADQALLLQPLQHLPGGCARDAEHLGHA